MFKCSEINESIPAAYQHTEAKRKWLPFRRWHFQVHFLEWKVLNFRWNFSEICSLGSIIDNMNRQQAIIWNNGGMFYRQIYASLGLHELKFSTWLWTGRSTGGQIWFMEFVEASYILWRRPLDDHQSLWCGAIDTDEWAMKWDISSYHCHKPGFFRVICSKPTIVLHS